MTRRLLAAIALVCPLAAWGDTWDASACDGGNGFTDSSGDGMNAACATTLKTAVDGAVGQVLNCVSGDCGVLAAAAGDSLDMGSGDSSRPCTRSTSVPATASEGQCHQDTDSGGSELYWATSTNNFQKIAAAAETTRSRESHVVPFPQAADTHFLPDFGGQTGITLLTRLVCVTTGGGTVPLTFQECTDYATCANAEPAIPCDADGEVVTAIDDAFIAPGAHVKVVVGTCTGTCDQVAYTIWHSHQVVR